MEKFKNIFRALDTRWLIRYYFYSLIVFIFVFMMSRTEANFFPNTFFFALITSLFYLFAMFIYENIVSMVMGDNIFIVSGCLALVWSVIKIGFIWTFAIPIGTIGLLYIYFRVNR